MRRRASRHRGKATTGRWDFPDDSAPQTAQNSPHDDFRRRSRGRRGPRPRRGPLIVNSAEAWRQIRFADRRDAGRQLAERLLPLAAESPVVLALPRGGVPVAREVALALGAPLDFLAVRKLGAPHNPEYGIGAVAEDGTRVIDPEAIAVLGIDGGGSTRSSPARPPSCAAGSPSTAAIGRRSTSRDAPRSSSTTASPPASPTPRRCGRRAAAARGAWSSPFPSARRTRRAGCARTPTRSSACTPRRASSASASGTRTSRRCPTRRSSRCWGNSTVPPFEAQPLSGWELGEPPETYPTAL